MKAKPLPSQADLLELLDYDPETGVVYHRARSIRWYNDTRHATADAIVRAWNTRFAGKRADKRNFNGYQRTSTPLGEFQTHRLVWKMVTGSEPDAIDHINWDKRDNRWVNLRSVTRSDNGKNVPIQSNNTSGTVGVYWLPKKERWLALITSQKKRIGLGSYCDKDEAIAARKAAERKYGFHPNHGRVA